MSKTKSEYRTEATELAYKFFKDDDKVKLWMNLPNSIFGDISPNDMIERNQGESLIRKIKRRLIQK